MSWLNTCWGGLFQEAGTEQYVLRLFFVAPTKNICITCCSCVLEIGSVALPIPSLAQVDDANVDLMDCYGVVMRQKTMPGGLNR